MKKIVILLICLLLLVGCKDDKVEENATKNEGEPVNVKTNDVNWAKVNETYIDSLNSKELIGEYSMSVPDWKKQEKNEYITYGEGNYTFIVMLYKNDVYNTDLIKNYSKTNSKKMTINSFDVLYEEGNVKNNGFDSKYISYYIDSDITLKIIGVSEEKNIKELSDTIKVMIES